MNNNDNDKPASKGTQQPASKARPPADDNPKTNTQEPAQRTKKTGSREPSADKGATAHPKKASNNIGDKVDHGTETTNKPADGATDFQSTVSSPSTMGSRSPALLIVCVFSLIFSTICVLAAMALWSDLSQIKSQHGQLQTENNALITRFKTALAEMEDNANKQRNHFNEQLRQQQSQHNKAFIAQNEKAESLDKKITQTSARFDRNYQRIDSLEKNLKALSGQKRTQWLLSEAYYLTKIAGQRLFINRDINTAIQLLEDADSRLIEVNDLNYNYVREALAADIGTLKSIPVTDSEGIVIAINTLIPQLESMPLISLHLPDNTEKDVDALDQQVTGWRNNLNKLLEEIKKDWIVVRHYEHNIEPLLTPNEQKYLNQNIILSLQQAQVAALRQQQKLFEQSLDKAIHWIEQFYFHNDQQSRAVLDSLAQLKSRKVTQKIPDKLESSQVLGNLVNPGQLPIESTTQAGAE